MVKKKPRSEVKVVEDIVDDVKQSDEDKGKKKSKQSFFSKLKKRANNEDDEPLVKINGSFKDNPFLNEVRPRQGYYFHSDYFEVDDKVAKIVTFINKGYGKKPLPIFWGINLIPQGLGQNVTVALIQSVDKMSESWIEEHQSTADKVSAFNNTETNKSVNRSEKKKAKSTSSDIDIIAEELIDGASYLHIHFRLLIKAPDLDSLDKAEEAVVRWYSSKFATLKIATHEGFQRKELTNLLAPSYLRQGKGFHMTSTEFAGNYNLVTQGLADSTGSFVGDMQGDVNNSGILMDIDKFSSHVVIAGDKKYKKLNKQFMSDLWALKMSNATLMNNRKSVHIVLNGADLENVGMVRADGSFIDLAKLTSKINMDHGDVNPLEIFGSIDPKTGKAHDELNAFSSHVEKLKLMLKQLYNASATDQSIIDGYMSKVINEYYESEGMWTKNAKANRDDLRVVGLPHESYPRLYSMVQTLERMHKAELVKGEKRDPNDLKAVNIIKGTFSMLLDKDGDLFDVYTNDVIDNASKSRRVIYDFSSLRERGIGLAMAQLVNIIDFATKRIDDGDLIVIHGAELLEPSVRKYMSDVIDGIIARGGRIAYVYNNVEKMLNDRNFNHFDTADYTVLGYMSLAIFDRYVEILKQGVPDALINLVTSKSNDRFYVRRGTDNIVFGFDPKLVYRGNV